jgi:hypothetical protein
MLASLVGAVLIVGLVVGPLLWRVWDDRRVENALRVRADLHMVLFRALQGDSFVTVDALPPTLWRPGQVVLNAPSDWQPVLESAWRAISDHVRPVGGRDLAVSPVGACRRRGAAPRGVGGIVALSAQTSSNDANRPYRTAERARCGGSEIG